MLIFKLGHKRLFFRERSRKPLPSAQMGTAKIKEKKKKKPPELKVDFTPREMILFVILFDIKGYN